jgi:hypothetical protein
VRTEPSLFWVGGVQSRVAVPVETGFGGGAVTGLGGGVKVTGPDPLSIAATVVELDTGVVLLAAGAVPWVVFPATGDERSITPTLGDTSGLEAADAAAEALDP